MLNQQNNLSENLNTDEISPELRELLEKARTEKIKDPLRIEQVFADLIQESDRGAVLIGVAFLDFLLALLITSRMIDGKTADKLVGFENGTSPLSSFAVRTDLAYALGWIGPETHRELNFLRKIRNKFAHSHDVEGFEHQQIKSWCNELNPPKWQEPVPAITVQGRSRFVFTTMKLSLRLRILIHESQTPIVAADQEVTSIHVSTDMSAFG